MTTAQQTKVYELSAQYDSRKSFYGKAQVIEEDGKIWLQSYDTRVACIENNEPYINGTYSVTTLRHIKEFLLQHGFKAESKQQIINDYMDERR